MSLNRANSGQVTVNVEERGAARAVRYGPAMSTRLLGIVGAGFIAFGA